MDRCLKDMERKARDLGVPGRDTVYGNGLIDDVRGWDKPSDHVPVMLALKLAFALRLTSLKRRRLGKPLTYFLR